MKKVKYEGAWSFKILEQEVNMIKSLPDQMQMLDFSKKENFGGFSLRLIRLKGKHVQGEDLSVSDCDQ